MTFRFTRDVGGYPFLYADIFMDRTEFEEMFDLVAYENVRAKYNANGAFPHLYDKVILITNFQKKHINIVILNRLSPKSMSFK